MALLRALLRAPPLASSLTMAPPSSSEQSRALSLLEKVQRCCVEGAAATAASSFQPFAVRDFSVEASSLDEVLLGFKVAAPYFLLQQVFGGLKKGLPAACS